MTKKILTHQELKNLLEYDKNTGNFFWKESRGNIKKGSLAGTNKKNWYVDIKINKTLYKAHRLAWLYVYEKWPSNYIDHINQIKNDNRIENIRDVSFSENRQNITLFKNNKLGVKGVCWDKLQKKYHVQISHNKKVIHLGYFKSIEEAKQKRKEAEIKYHACRIIE